MLYLQGITSGKYLEREVFQHHYFFTQMVLPMSTFALAIGRWSMVQIIDESICMSYRKKSSDVMGPCSGVEGRTTKSDIRCDNIHEPYPCHITRGDSGPYLPCRLFGPPDLITQVQACESWKLYIPACLKASYELLGSHPFSKLDLLFLPRCFSGLGLASPSLVFLSQSLFVNNGTVSRANCLVMHDLY